MNQETMQLLLNGILAIATILVTGVLVPYLKQKYGIEKIQKAYTWACIAVNAAEQIYNESKMGPEKYEYVSNFLTSKGFNLSKEEVQAMIESIVKEFNDSIDVIPTNVEK